jgi:ACS family hexuronate transporter-like MFS transporter
MTTMLLAAIFMPGSIFAYYADSFGACVAFITLATACHQAWSANLFTNATDMFPGKVAGSVVGLGATAGGIGGMFMTLLAGLAVQWTGNQQIVFVWAGGMHLLALALFWFWFKGRFVQVNVDSGRDETVTHRGLLVSGGIITIFGLALSALVYGNWQTMVAAVKATGAAQAAVVAVGFVVIGVALLHAGSSRRLKPAQ